MITFLPYSDYTKSAKVLDRQRLGKQRSETWILLEAITIGNDWKKHPAAKMWKGYHYSLIDYGIAICTEWINRGYKDTLLEKFAILNNNSTKYEHPWWLGDKRLHLSHQFKLLDKDYNWYCNFFSMEQCINYPEYWWPNETQTNC